MSRLRGLAPRRRVTRFILGLAVMAASGLPSSAARAQEATVAPEPGAGPEQEVPHAEASIYEERRMRRVLEELALEPAFHPEGKGIAFVRVVRHEVFVPDEAWPTFPNVLHALTDERVIRRELLFDEGDAYREEVVQESMRNLRALNVFALVRIEAVETSDLDKVGVVVHTRDLWSLRLEQNFQVVGDQVNQLRVQLAERNLFGRNKVALARFALLPKTLEVGQQYYDYRLFGGEVALLESFDVILNRSSGHAEGAVGQVAVARPFYNLGQRWSFSVQGDYDVRVARALERGEVATYAVPGTGGQQTIARVWDDRRISALGQVTYRHGSKYRQSFSAGFGAADRSVAANAETDLQPEHAEIFARDVLPRVRREVYPMLAYDLFLPSFVVLENLGSFGRSEAVRVGPRLQLRVTLPLELYGSSSNGFTAAGAFQYVSAWEQTFLALSLQPSARLEDGEVINQLLVADIRFATPPWFGRFVTRLRWEGRRNDQNRVPVSLGGDNGLRGYPQQAFLVVGGSMLQGNLEYRSPPVVFSGLHVGGVAFYDAGAVYARTRDARLRHAVGLGLRLLLPHLNQYAFRMDGGVPLDSRGFNVMLSFGSSQAVLLTEEEGAAANTTTGLPIAR